MNVHLIQIKTSPAFTWFECSCGDTGFRYYAFNGARGPERDALEHLDCEAEWESEELA